MTSLSKRLRYRLEWLALASAAWVFARLSRNAAHRVADVVSGVASVVHREGRRIGLSNLRVAFGERFSEAQRRALVRHSYQNFGRAVADLFWSSRVTPENLHTIFDLSDLERLRAERGDGGMIFACLHYGSFEWITLALGLSGFPSTVVTQAFKNPLLDPLVGDLRGAAGHPTVRREGALLRLFKALRGGRNVIFAVDLTISARLPSVPITCFGMETCVTFAHAWLHKRTGAPIIPTVCERLPDGRCRLVLLPAIEPGPDATYQEIAQACWAAFEPLVRQNPAPWLWMYKHWRYLPPDPQHAYPEYANRSPHFRKLLLRTAKEKAAHEAAASLVV